jgi:hypothetical protein
MSEDTPLHPQDVLHRLVGPTGKSALEKQAQILSLVSERTAAEHSRLVRRAERFM